MADDTIVLDADVIVVGAGPGGLMSALELARAGRKVLVLEKKPKDRIGLPIRVTLEETVFSEAGLDFPEAPTRIKAPMSREFISPDSKHKVKVRNLPQITVEMRSFLSGMLTACEEKGVSFSFETSVTGPMIESGSVVGVVGTSVEGRMLELRAPLSIDGSGISGVLRHNLSEDMGVQREIDARDFCNAWQSSLEIDRQMVMDLLERNRIRPQVNVARIGINGPYSMLSVYIDLDEDLVELTAGVLHDSRYTTSREMVEHYVESHHWIGEQVSGGGALIPVRRPLDSFVADGFACVGDAACQAMPMHASGVSSALLAGKALARVAAAALERGDITVAALWAYNNSYMRSRGSASANSDLFRRMLIKLRADELSELFARGLITGEGVAGSLDALALELPKGALISAGVGMLGRPRLIFKLARLSRGALKVLDLYQGYPGEYDQDLFERWKAQARRIFR